MEKRFEKLLAKLGKEISDSVLFSCSDFEKIIEIRITVNKPIHIITYDKIIRTEKCINISEIRNIFASLCEFSVHAYKNEICRGFITVEGGIRIGICGTALYENGKISGIKDISALNIRIPHEIFNSAERITPLAAKGGILVIGPPCSGKTTILRDLAKKCSAEHNTVIVDERFEIAGICHGEPSFDIGNSAVLNGFSKKDGIEFAVRSMAPEIIICDEFGDENDISSALYAMKSGTNIVASAHALSREVFLSKPFIKKIIEYKIFRYYVFLGKNFEISEIVPGEEISK